MSSFITIEDNTAELVVAREEVGELEVFGCSSVVDRFGVINIIGIPITDYFFITVLILHLLL